VNARDLLEVFEPELGDVRAKASQATSALSPMLEEAKRFYASQDPDTRVLLGLGVGLLLGKVVGRLGR
jgi:hypothetical protein